jgi:hypothetical protein
MNGSRRPSASRLHVLLALLIAPMLLACAAQDGGGGAPPTGTTQMCLPGLQSECPCSDGSRGVMVCDAQGAAFGACTCAGGATPVQPVAPTAGSDAQPPSGGSAGADTGGAPGTTDPPVVGPQAADLARDVRIREIAIYQAVKIALMQDGAPVVARNAPVIVGKEGILRVFVETLPGFSPRELRAELSLVSINDAVQPITITQRVNQSSTDAELASTLNFDIPGESVTEDLRYAVALREVGPATATGSVDPGARWPAAEGELIELGPRSAGPLRVMLIPYRYMADGSQRLPAMDDAEIAEYGDFLRVYYPASQIEIEIHEPVDYTRAVGPQTGWNEWLDFHCALRAEEDPDPKVLYYGTIAPTEGWQSYGGGIVGISPVPGPAGNYGRCSVGIGFPGGAGTMAHELGHSLGLPHAPCGTEGGPYPYAEAKIGSWGFGLVSRTLKDPNEFYDLMSYCDPSFISDYNYERLFERIRYLNLQFDLRPEPTVRYARLLQHGDGRIELRGSMELDAAPGGPEDEREVTLLDATGRATGSARAYYFALSEAGAGVWLVPETGAAAARIGGLAAALRR